MNIPKTIELAEAQLVNIGGIVTAKEWERAAIVYAFTEVGEANNEGGKPATSSRLSVREFAKLGIIGLKSKDTVRKYHTAWVDACDAGEALPIGPGDTFNEPDLKFPPNDNNTGSRVSSNPRKAGKQLAEKFTTEELAEAIESAAEVDLDAAVKGTGKAAVKATGRTLKELDAEFHDDNDEYYVEKPRVLTDKGAGDMLMHVLHGTNGWEKASAMLSEPGLVLDSGDREALIDAVARTSAAMLTAEALILEGETVEGS